MRAYLGRRCRRACRRQQKRVRSSDSHALPLKENQGKRYYSHIYKMLLLIFIKEKHNLPKGKGGPCTGGEHESVSIYIQACRTRHMGMGRSIQGLGDSLYKKLREMFLPVMYCSLSLRQPYLHSSQGSMLVLYHCFV